MSSDDNSKAKANEEIGAGGTAVGSRLMKIDVAKLTEDDVHLFETARRDLAISTIGGAVVGGALPYLALKRVQGFGGRFARVAAVAGGSLAGMLLGTLYFTRNLTDQVGQLPNNSQIKKIANQVLVDRYPMAVAEEMDNRRAAKKQ